MFLPTCFQNTCSDFFCQCWLMDQPFWLLKTKFRAMSAVLWRLPDHTTWICSLWAAFENELEASASALSGGSPLDRHGLVFSPCLSWNRCMSGQLISRLSFHVQVLVSVLVLIIEVLNSLGPNYLTACVLPRGLPSTRFSEEVMF